MTPEEQKTWDEWKKMRSEFMKNGGCIPTDEKPETAIPRVSRTLANQHFVSEAIVRSLQPHTDTNGRGNG